MNQSAMTGYPHIDKPWMQYYDKEAGKGGVFDGSMYEYLKIHSENHCDAIAINYFGKAITYTQLIARIDQCAQALERVGIRSGDSIAVSLLPMPEAAILLYAANKVGAVFVAIPITDSPENIAEKMEKRTCRVLFSLPSVIERFEDAGIRSGAHLIPIPLWVSAPLVPRLAMRLKDMGDAARARIWKSFLAGEMVGERWRDEPSSRPLESTAYAAVVYTGGTTGKPKGVPVSNRAANAVASYYACGAFEFNSGDRFLDVMPPFLAYGLFAGIHMPLCLGMELVMCPDVRPAAFSAYFAKYMPEHVTAGPGHLDSLMNDKSVASMSLSFLKTAGYGGDSVSREWEERFFIVHS